MCSVYRQEDITLDTASTHVANKPRAQQSSAGLQVKSAGLFREKA